jgi:RNA recognition motif-containing protein
VGDLEPEVDEKYLRNVFGQNQNVKSIHIYKDKITNGKVNYAFLEFETPDIAEKVLHLFNGKEKPRFGKPFKINWGNQKSKRERPSNMFGGVPPQYGNNRFQGMPGGFNHRMNPMMPHPGMPGMRGMYPGNGMNPGMLPPPPMMNPQYKNMYPPGRGGPDPGVFSIYVGDLDGFCEQHHLADFFKGKYKSVTGAKVIKDHVTKKNKGFGFVHFDDGNEAEIAIKEMNGKMFMGRRIKTGRSFAKNQNMGMQQHRNPMYMMGRGMHPQMGMGRPMMPYPRQPYMMGRPPHLDQNQQKNLMIQKQRNPYHEQSQMMDRQPRPSNPHEIGHYRKTSNSKMSPHKQPSYMISSKNEKSEYESKDISSLKRVKQKQDNSYKLDDKIELKLINDGSSENEKKEKNSKKEEGRGEKKENLDDTKDKSEKNDEGKGEIEDKKMKTQSRKEKKSPKGKKDNESEHNISKGLLSKRAEMDKDDNDSLL